MGRGKDRSSNRRSLPAALGALIEIAGRHQTKLLAAACRALETMRPACRDHDRLALLLGAVPLFELRLAEALLELHNITSHRLNLMKPRRISALLSGVS